MKKVKILSSKVQGTLSIPTSKSHTMRALLFSLMAKGKSRIIRPLPSLDTMAMIDAIRHFGAKVDMQDDETLIIEGVAGKLNPAEDVIQCGNSGQILRFIGALSALIPSYTVLTGDLSIRHSRQVSPLIDGLVQLGAMATSTRLDGYAPIIVKGPLTKHRAKILGQDSQPVSGLLILGAFSPLTLEVINPGEKPWVNLTLDWFKRLEIPYKNERFERYQMEGNAKIEAFDYRVPGDFSSAAFPMAAALVTKSELTLDNIDQTDVQGDKVIIDVLKKMGAEFESEKTTLHIKKIKQLKGTTIDVNDFIDALPILAVISCFAEGKTEITNALIARKKESDRIQTIIRELKKMGAKIEEKPDGLTIYPTKLKGTNNLNTHRDHRIGMALAVAAMGAEGESIIHEVDCIAKSYPQFFEDLSSIGAKMARV